MDWVTFAVCGELEPPNHSWLMLDEIHLRASFYRKIVSKMDTKYKFHKNSFMIHDTCTVDTDPVTIVCSLQQVGAARTRLCQLQWWRVHQLYRGLWWRLRVQHRATSLLLLRPGHGQSVESPDRRQSPCSSAWLRRCVDCITIKMIDIYCQHYWYFDWMYIWSINHPVSVILPIELKTESPMDLCHHSVSAFCH